LAAVNPIPDDANVPRRPAEPAGPLRHRGHCAQVPDPRAPLEDRGHHDRDLADPSARYAGL